MAQKDKIRKLAHLKIGQDPANQDPLNLWDTLPINYLSLPDKDFDSLQTTTTFLNKTLSLPLIIGALTFPVDQKTRQLNNNLVRLAEEKKLAFNVGSQRIMVENNLDAEAKRLRRLAPTACILANFGAVQLNYGWGIEDARRCVDTLEADALVLHLNCLQELIQPEGHKNFKGLLQKIELLVKKISVPLIIKEVGMGIDPQTAKRLYDLGVYGIDVAGKGGTNWAKIEAGRRQDDWAVPFYTLGYSAPDLVKEISKFKPKDRILIASGGIRNGLHIAKALWLGADLASAAYPFLIAGQKGYSELVKLYNKLHWQYKVSLMVIKNDQNS